MPYKDKDFKKEYDRNWSKNNPEKRRGYNRHNGLKRNYGITKEQFIEMLNNQDWRCLGCMKQLTESDPVDHCHTTGRIRGVLCGRCNTLAGYLETTPDETMERMLRYLWNHRVFSRVFSPVFTLGNTQGPRNTKTHII